GAGAPAGRGPPTGGRCGWGAGENTKRRNISGSKGPAPPKHTPQGAKGEAEGRPDREDRPPALRDECRSLRGIPGENGEFSPFLLQDRVLEVVPPPAVPPAGLAANALAPEAARLVAANGAFVVRVHVKRDPVQAQRSKAEVQQQPDRFRAVALALRGTIADQNSELRRPMRERCPVETAGADQALPFPEHDAELVV